MELCDGESPAVDILRYMEQRNFDVMGLSNGSGISRYVARALLTGPGKCCEQGRSIEPTEIVSSTTPLIDFLPLMKGREYLFVLEGARLESIVTSADLQKPPVRMLLFGLVSLLDMFLLALVRKHCPGDSFSASLNPRRLEEARTLFEKRRARNEETDLADCLQICDKRDLILKLLPHKDLGFETRSSAERHFKHAETLRKRLAHSQDLVHNSSWAAVIALAERNDAFLRRNERMIANG